jgi:fluoroacetyl-CoA thioesterase
MRKQGIPAPKGDFATARAALCQRSRPVQPTGSSLGVRIDYLWGIGFAASTPSRSVDRDEERMKEIPIGAKGDFALVVAPEHLANRFKDTTLPAVLATPVMIMVMENAALNAIKPYLDPGERAVGTRIDIRHVAPTPAGLSVVGEAEVTGVDGWRIEFTVRAADDVEEIGAGTHERVIVDLARLAKRLDAKRTR